jgi:hypothetical protein
MSVSSHLEQAVSRIERAQEIIQEVRRAPATLESQATWLAALTDLCAAMLDVQTFNNESVHEKLHLLGGRIGMRDLAPPRPRE